MIAIICPVHMNTDIVAAQIKNYESVHGDQAMHFLHPSIAGGVDFSGIKKRFSINCDVEICKEQWPTHYRCTIGAAASATRMIKGMGGDISHVYYHSDGDLLVTRGFVETIKTHDNGYASRSIAAVRDKKPNEVNDPRFKAIRDELGLGVKDIRVGRIEGCFFQFDVWLEIFRLVEKYYPKEFLALESHWPLEAALFPTIARKLLNQEKPTTRHLVRTKYIKPGKGSDHAREFEDSKIQIEDIVDIRNNNAENLCCALKWFSHDISHPARKFLIETL